MLESGYYIAGMLMPLIAVISIVATIKKGRSKKGKPISSSKQNAKAIGFNNSISQNANVSLEKPQDE
jgi:hypothetical protein